MQQKFIYLGPHIIVRIPSTLYKRGGGGGGGLGLNIIQFRSISVSFANMHFFNFKVQMLGLQNIFVIVKFFNWIFCNKGLKAKISCFSSYFSCLTLLRLKCSRIRKTASFLTSHRLKKYKNLDPRSFTNEVKTW